MKKNIRQLMDFDKVDKLLEDYNKSTGFVTAILDLEGNVLSKSGWRCICTNFHRQNPETANRCLKSDTELANQMTQGKKYHFYKCLNGLIDVATPIIVDGEHIANLFTGQFFFEEPDMSFFKEQAKQFGFDENDYISALKDVPIVSKDKVIASLDFLSSMAQFLSELANQKTTLSELNNTLRESEELFKSVFDNSNVGKSITSRNGRLSVNKAFADMLGYEVEELSKIKWQDITPKEDVEVINKIIEPLVVGVETSTRFEKRYIKKDGGIIWADVSVVIQRDSNGDQSHFITTIVDITERKEAEHLLKISEEKFYKAFNVGPNGMTITRISDGKFLDANESFCELFGYKKQDVVGRTSTDLKMWSPEERRKIIDAQTKEGGLSQTELTAFTKSGNKIDIIFSSNTIEIDKEHYLITIMIDITDKKRSEKELEKQSEIFKALVEQSITGIYIFRKEGFLYVNQRFADIFGYSVDEVLENLKPTDVVKPNERENANKNIDKRLSGKVDSVHYIAEGLHKTNKKLWIEIHGTHINIDGEDVITGTVLDITEKYDQELRLIESERKFRTLFEQASVGVAIIDTESGRYVSVNDKQCEILGYTNEEILSLDFMALTHPGDLEVDLNNMDNLKNGVVDKFRMEKRYIQKSGNIVWVVLNVYPLWKKGEYQNFHVAICEDITELKNLEIEKHKFHRLAESSSEFIGMCDLNLNPLYVNPAGIEMVGLANLEAACNVKVQDYFYPEDQSFIEKDFFPRVLKEGHGDIEIRLRHFQTGEPIWMFYYLFHVLDSSGEPIGWATVSRNITERKLADKILKESENRYRSLFENMNAGFVLFEVVKNSKNKPVDLKIVAANSGFEKTTGLNLKEAEGKNLTKVLPGIEKDEADWIGKYTKIALDGGSLQFEQISELLDTYYSVSAFHAGPGLCAVTFTDISDRKKAEIEILTLNKELEQRVRDRTKMLESVNKELEAFTYSVSHDLRAPLRHISGYADLLSRKYSSEMPEKADYYLDTISDSAQHLGTLIDELLQFSRTGRQELIYKEVDINNLVKKEIELLETSLMDRNVRWNVDNLPKVIADEKLIQLVFQNLIDNAVKFTSKTEDPIIHIGVNEMKDEYELFIKDNGVGFDMKYASKLFGIFQRMHSQSEFEGTGIGLANVRRIISKHGGRAWANAELNKGATFYVTLPKSKV